MSAEKPCPFCEIVAGQYGVAQEWRPEPGRVVATFGTGVAFVPRDPVVPGHTLIVPRKHLGPDHEDYDLHLAFAARHARGYARQQGGDHNLILNQGAEAGQTVDHLHWHYIPRREGDRLLLPWSAQQASTDYHNSEYGIEVVGEKLGPRVDFDPASIPWMPAEVAHATGLALIAGAYRQGCAS